MVKNIRVTRYRPAPFHERIRFSVLPGNEDHLHFRRSGRYQIESEVMNAHQKASIGNFLIKKTMGLYYKVPEDLNNWCIWAWYYKDKECVMEWSPSPQPSLLYGYALLAVE